jgi:outer membrane protein assembly factor BamB
MSDWGTKSNEVIKVSTMRKRMQLPLRHKDTRVHKELIFNDLFLVLLCALVPLWQEKNILIQTNHLKRYFLPVILSMVCLLSIHAQTGDYDWPLFRGRADLSGRSDTELPVAPQLLWSVATGTRTKSSPVISDGTLFFGNEKGTLTAISTEGKIKWTYEAGSALDAAPMVYGKKVIFGSGDGILRAVDKLTGKLLWSYPTDNQIAGSANVWISGKKSGIVVGSYDYYLHCVDPETGKSLWKHLPS